MAYARQCPFCGAYLDPCEICDCQTEERNTAPGIATSGGGTNKTDKRKDYENKKRERTSHHHFTP